MGRKYPIDKLGPAGTARSVVDAWRTKRSRDWAEAYWSGIQSANLDEMERKLTDWYTKLDKGRAWLTVAMAMIKAGVPTEVAKEVLAMVRTR